MALHEKKYDDDVKSLKFVVGMPIELMKATTKALEGGDKKPGQ